MADKLIKDAEDLLAQYQYELKGKSVFTYQYWKWIERAVPIIEKLADRVTLNG